MDLLTSLKELFKLAGVTCLTEHVPDDPKYRFQFIVKEAPFNYDTWVATLIHFSQLGIGGVSDVQAYKTRRPYVRFSIKGKSQWRVMLYKPTTFNPDVLIVRKL